MGSDPGDKAMNWTGIKVLVTGAGGFIGSHLTDRLVREGADVRAFVRYTSSGSPGLLSMLDAQVQGGIECRCGMRSRLRSCGGERGEQR